MAIPMVRSRVWLSFLILGILFPTSVQAQVISDGSTGTIVTGNPNFTITNGTQVGSNLFHSFSQFSVPTGGRAFFNNALTVQNIISRVTGGTVSSIDGLIQSNGSANLFLINPAGISFGANARLQIGGSFLGTTASSLKFADGSEFVTTRADAPLLTVSVPIGLQFGANPGAIVAQGAQLAVPDGNTLALIGARVTLRDGSLRSKSGHVTIGAVSGATPSVVGLNAQGSLWAFNYAQDHPFQPVELSNQQLDTSGIGGGSIQIVGDRISLSNGTRLTADTEGDRPGQGILIQARQFLLDHSLISSSTFGAGAGGTVTINAREQITLSGAGDLVDVFQQVYAGTFDRTTAKNGVYTVNFGSGQGGNVELNTRQLTLEKGAGILTSTFASGAAGNVIISARDRLTVNRGFIATNTTAVGRAGDITMQTGQILLQNLAAVEATTLAAGPAGTISVTATESIEIVGSPFDLTDIATGFFASSFPQFEEILSGSPGNILINTRQLQMRDGAFIGAANYGNSQDVSTVVVNASEAIELIGVTPNSSQFPTNIYADAVGTANAGQLLINTQKLTLQGGALISAGTFESGRGGNLTINATDSITLVGGASATQAGIENGYFVFNNRFPSGLITSSVGTGDAGDLTVVTGNLTIEDGAVIAVNGQGTGNAGNLIISADRVSLRNQAAITVGTASGEGGNLWLTASLVVLRQGSSITATAGGTGNGGNITIDAPFIVAVPSENSDIIANAVQGRGGNIQITTSGIYGLQFRPFLTSKSDITASSEFGLSGTVTIVTPNVNPTVNSIELATELADPTQQIAQGCNTYKNSRFVATGRGGLPDNPNQRLQSRRTWTDVRDVAQVGNTNLVTQSPAPIEPILVEANSWHKTASGDIELIANYGESTVSPDRDATCVLFP